MVITSIRYTRALESTKRKATRNHSFVVVPALLRVTLSLLLFPLMLKVSPLKQMKTVLLSIRECPASKPFMVTKEDSPITIMIGNRLTDMTHDTRKEARSGKLRTLLEDFFSWAKEEYGVSLHETHYGKALEYALKEETKVMRVFEDGRLELENNLAERTVKPFVIGRKDWLFANTPHGVEASCILYSIVQTAIMNGLIPFEYIKYLLETMPGKALTNDLIESLLPWSETIPEYVRVPPKRDE